MNIPAKEAHRNVSNRSQSIIISGESGAGKTECTRHNIKFLSVSAQKDLMNILNSASTIMNAFGNTATDKNTNSSRYAKFVEVSFVVVISLKIYPRAKQLDYFLYSHLYIDSLRQ